MKKNVTLLLMLCMSLYSFSQNKSISEFTANHLQSFLQELPSSVLKGHGFNSKNEFLKAKVGTAYQVMSIQKDGSLLPTGFHQIVLTVDGENRNIVTVGEIDGKLDIQGIGYAPLSNELQNIETSSRKNKQSHAFMINDYYNQATYVTYSENLNNVDLIPLASANSFLGEKLNERIKSTYKLSEIAEIMNAN